MFKNALYLCSIKGIGFLMLLVEVVNETKIALLLIKLVGSPYLYSFSSIAVCNRTLDLNELLLIFVLVGICNLWYRKLLTN